MEVAGELQRRRANAVSFKKGVRDVNLGKVVGIVALERAGGSVEFRPVGCLGTGTEFINTSHAPLEHKEVLKLL